MGERCKALRCLCLAALLSVAAASPVLAVCTKDEVDLRGPWGHAKFFVEIADDTRERATGLMHRQSLNKSSGMLFVYKYPTELSFWMRNTLIPLDLLFIDKFGRVTRIHHNAKPRDETTIPSDGKVVAVLEINGGLARKYGITKGSEVRHETFEASGAAWPCE